MGLIQKRDERDYIDGIEVIGRGEGPDGLEESPVELAAGESAEDIAARDKAAADEAASDSDAGESEDEEASADVDVSDGEADADEPHEADGDTEGAEADAADGADSALDATTSFAAHDAAPVASDAVSAPARHGRKAKLLVAGAIVAVIAAAIVGYFVGAGGFGAQGTGTATLTDAMLDTTVASWTYDGARASVTAREVIESSYSLDAVKNADGTYAAPAAEDIIGYVRNVILLDNAKELGIELTDDEVAAYAKKNLGTSDFASIASSYGVSEEQAKSIVRDSSTIQRLYEDTVGFNATMPQAPSEPAAGAESTPTEDYASYIIEVAGSEWDADKGTWASEGGAVAQALADTGFDGKTATYDQAKAAYTAAYQAFMQKSSEASATWRGYVNDLFSHAQVTVYGIYA